MASEIEVGEVVESRDHRSDSAAAAPEDKSSRNDVYWAAANGDMEKLRRLVEDEGCSVSEPDAEGYYALHRAALNNLPAIAQYIIEHGGDINARMRIGQTALHWSAVRGSIEVAELLLQEGACISAADCQGYQTTHVAAQYGQTVFLCHIVTKWKADADVLDNDGRSPLHWAAYKGFPDCICLLLYLKAHRTRQDKEGCTPLHWAAFQGKLEACNLLVMAGKKEDLMVTECAGCTAAQLAADRNHRQVAFFLENARRLFDRRCDNNSFLSRLSRLGLALILWSLNLPILTAGFGLFAWMGVFLALTGLVFCFRCSSKDPGFIRMNVHDPENTKDDEPLLKFKIKNSALIKGKWSQLCATCKIVRPLCAKHCITCNRCVEQFECHSAWVSNCIGKKNKRDFVLFIILEVVALLISGSVALTRVLTDPLAPSTFGALLRHAAKQHVGALAFLAADAVILYAVKVLSC